MYIPYRQEYVYVHTHTYLVTSDGIDNELYDGYNDDWSQHRSSQNPTKCYRPFGVHIVTV